MQPRGVSADKGDSSDADVRTFWCSWIFRNFWCSYRQGGSIFRDFARTSFMDGY